MPEAEESDDEQARGPADEVEVRFLVSVEYPDTPENRVRGKVGQWYADESTTGPMGGYPSFQEALGRTLEIEVAQGLNTCIQMMYAATVTVYLSGTTSP